MAFERGLMWVVLDDVLVPRVGWHEDPAVDLLAQLEHMRLAPGVGIPGRAWSERRPVGVPYLPDQPGYESRDDGTRDGVRAQLSIPAVHQEEVLAVVSFSSKEEITLTERLVQTFTGLGYELGLFLTHHRADLGPSQLTPRELDVLRLASQGMTSNAIARQLVIEPSTVNTHLQHIYRKLGVPDRAAAVARSLRQGMIH
jgi:DNA-binding NarL/FixJ family response regulator